ncbi:MAG: hypothetical protein NW226_24055, partial [Microscillaceae bacterium]|nr:hypothetical protein [Microscillaceae bacterium]
GSKDCLLLLDQGERKIEVEVGDTFSYDHSTWKVLYIPESAKGVYIKKIRLFPRIGLIVLKGSLLTKLWA